MSYADERAPLLSTNPDDPSRRGSESSERPSSGLCAKFFNLYFIKKVFMAFKAAIATLIYTLTAPIRWIKGCLDRIENPLFVFVYNVICCSQVNWLLPFVPIGIIAGMKGVEGSTLFCLNLLAIVPLAAILSYATEQLEGRWGPALSGLINASLGNAVELIVAFVALQKGDVRIVQTSMIGSILSNLLLVLGFSLAWAGFCGKNGSEQALKNTTAAGSLTNLMFVACCSIVISAAFAYAIPVGAEAVPKPGSDPKSIVDFSHYASILLLMLYFYYLYFSLWSHPKLFNGKSDEDVEAQLDGPNEAVGDEEEEEEEEPKMSPGSAIATLLVTLVFIYYCADYLVESISAVVATGYVSSTFVGMILLPIAANAAEHTSAIIFAGKGKLDLALQVVVGSSTQIALLAIPACVLMGWYLGQPMTLHFDALETSIMFISTILVCFLLLDGRTNMLEGNMCLVLYGLIALVYFYYPDGSNLGVSPNAFKSDIYPI